MKTKDDIEGVYHIWISSTPQTYVNFHIKDIEWFYPLSCTYDERWQRDEWSAIVFAHGMWCVYTYIPAGYSSYTYAPECSLIGYPDYSTDKFINLGLDQHQRSYLTQEITKKMRLLK